MCQFNELMNMIKKITLLYLVLAGLFSCEDPYNNTTFVNADEVPNGLYLSTHEEFSEWVAILNYADMYNAVNEASSTFTVFAPTNDAVKAFYATKGVSSAQELNAKQGYEYMRELVKYHLINKKIERKNFLLGGRLSSPTLSEDYLTVTINGDATDANSVFVEDAGVKELAIETNNGLIYVMNSVLNPITETLYDQLSDNKYSIFKAAIDATGWNARLSKLNDTTYQEYGAWYVTKRKFTVFAVPDEIFQSNGISSVSELSTLVGAENDYTSVKNKLNRYVAYHIVSSVKFAEDLFGFSTDSTFIWNTLVSDGVLTSTNVNGADYINYITSDSTGTQLLDKATYTLAKNGVIHDINGLLTEYTPAPVKVIWDFVNREEIGTVINAWGAANSFGDCYQTFFEYGTAGNTDISLTAYEFDFWEYSANTSNGNWSKVGYYLLREMGNSSPGYNGNYFGTTSASVYVPGSGAYFDDFLIVNVGFMGTMKITTPTILKGRYQVTLRHGYEGTMWDIASGAGSKVKFTLDDLPFEATLYKQSKISAQSSALMLEDVLWTEIEFPETGSHTFGLVVMDPLASTHSNYRLLLDYLKFEPVE